MRSDGDISLTRVGSRGSTRSVRKYIPTHGLRSQRAQQQLRSDYQTTAAAAVSQRTAMAESSARPSSSQRTTLASPSAASRAHHRHSTPTSPEIIAQRRLSNEAPHGLGETEAQHAAHANISHTPHFGLSVRHETLLFYCLAIPSWGLEIAAGVFGAEFHTWGKPFIATITAFLVLHWAAWLQTAVGMMQRASWVRDEGDLVDRRQFLYLAVRLNRLMLVSSSYPFPTHSYQY